jgi:hypothetical protein
VSLQDYIVQTQDLIRDQQGLFVSQQTLIGYINDARAATSELTGCCRRLIVGQSPFGAQAQAGSAVAGGMMPGMPPIGTFQTIVGQERYPYIGYGNLYLNNQYRGLRGICDVISVSGSWGGAVRPSLDWMPFEEFQAFCRSNIILVTNYPVVFTIYNDGEGGEVWLFPVPQSANEMEWDTFCTAGAIYTNDDFDAVPEPFKNGVKYYAAARAFEARGSYAAAQLNYQRWFDSNQMRRGASDRGKVPTHYNVWP